MSLFMNSDYQRFTDYPPRPYSEDATVLYKGKSQGSMDRSAYARGKKMFQAE